MTQFPPRVWHGVVEPDGSGRIPPVKCTQYELAYAGDTTDEQELRSVSEL